MSSQKVSVDNLIDSLNASLSLKSVNFKVDKDFSNVVTNILNKNTYRENGKTHEEFLVEFFNDDTLYWIHKDNISDYTFEVIEERNKFNTTIKNKSGNSFLNNYNTIVYCRCSSINDTSISTQKEYTLKYCYKNDLLLKNISYDNGISGRYDSKKQCMNNYYRGELGFIDKLLKPFDTLVVYSIDRLGRHALSVLHFIEKCVERNISIIFTKEEIRYDKNTPSHIKKIVAQQIIDSEHLSNLTSEKVKNTIRLQKEKGHYLGKAGYGYKISKNKDGIRKLAYHKEQQNVIKMIIRKYKLFSNKSMKDKYGNTVFPKKSLVLKQIVEYLESREIKYIKDKPFNTKNINYLIKREETNAIDM